MKNALKSIRNRADHMEEGISKIYDGNLEIIQVDEKREIRCFKNEGVLNTQNSMTVF